MDDAQLQTIWQQRQLREPAVSLSKPLTVLMKHRLGKRVRQLGKLADIWREVVPGALLDHTSLTGFSRGTLTVRVDSAAHRYQLRTLLDGGLQREIQSRLAGPLNKIRLVPGRIDDDA